MRLDKAISWDDWTVVLLDEVSWMGRYDPDFPARLKSAWDMMLKHHDRLVVVICGSVSTWIKKNILENTGFAGRFSRDLVVRELPLSQCKAFWGDAAERLSPSEIIDVLSAYSVSGFEHQKETLEDYFMKYYKEDKNFGGVFQK